MTYGRDIGKKFYEDGTVRRFVGNTVVADITPEVPAYGVMRRLNQMVEEAELTDYLILLPADSYHMTVIQGINDQSRGPDRWPPALPVTATMEEADAYFAAAINRAGLPGPARMKFSDIFAGSGCVLAQLDPADAEQEKILRDFRDRAATEIGLFIPNHRTYKFHISLAYIRVIPEGEAAQRLQELVQKMNAILAAEPPFLTTAPYIAYFNDMFAFSPKREW